MKKKRTWLGLILRLIMTVVRTVVVSLVFLILASGMSSFPRGSPLMAGVTRNQQLAVLAALGSVSLVALYVWYQKRADKAKKMARANLADATAGVAASTTSLKEDDAAANGKVPAANEDVDEAAVRVMAATVTAAAPPTVTPKTAEHPVVSSTPIANEDTVSISIEEPKKKKEVVIVEKEEHEREETSSSASSDLSDTDSHSAKSSGARSDADFDIEPSTLETEGALKLDVQNFSWAEEVERSYSEAMASEQAQERERLEGGFEGAESPGLTSQGSDDSGRATGGLASSLSPMDDHSVTTTPNGTVTDSLPMYEFEIPNSLVGLIIGVKGKTIKELSVRTDVRMLIRQHHSSEKVDTHQICQVRGKRDKINRCLQMLRKRFPPARFPELNLQPVLPPALPTNLADLLNAQPSWLTLPDDVACEAAIVHLIDAGHLFVQQPTHPSFSSLAKLDQYMILLYSQTTGIPELPNPCETGLLCAAPVCKAWFRAVIVMYFPEDDAVLVRFVDYGGYARMPRGDLRQIRTDLVTLPFQATECFLAHVQPVDGTSQWSQEATDFLRELVAGKVVDVTLIGYSVDEKIPVVEIELIEAEGQKVRVDRLLIQNGLAKAADPSKVQRVFGATSTKQRPGLSKQTSVVNGQV